MTASRRSLLAILGTATVTAPTLAAASPDAALLALCARHGEIHRALDALNKASGYHEEEMGRLASEHEDVGDQIAEITPTTRAGVLAKARATRDAVDLGWDSSSDRLENRMAFSLLDDLLASEGLA